MKYTLTLLLLMASLNCQAGLYKWTDADGKVHYTDKPAPADASSEETLNIRSAPETEASGAAPTKNIFELEADLKKEQKAKEEEDKKAAQQAQAAQAKRKNCEISRNNLQTLENSPRITTYDAQGAPIVMDDSARQRGIAEAQKGISEFCN